MSDELIGYCIALRFETAEGPVAWITQLVVASNYRKAGVATHMMFSIWQFSDCWAWGLVTANPFAVRALETATRRSCRASAIAELGQDVLTKLATLVSYIPSEFVEDASGRQLPVVDTAFFVDHSDLPKMLKGAARKKRPWNWEDSTRARNGSLVPLDRRSPTN